jgi:SAM-dependent methyltransferase
VLDLCEPHVGDRFATCFDLVVSRMTAEHVKDPESYHRNIRTMLRPGGVAFHFFPTLWTLPLAINRILPDFVTEPLLRLVAPRDSYQEAKFPAYYRSGPPLHRLEMAKARRLVSRPVPALTSFAYVVMRRIN